MNDDAHDVLSTSEYFPKKDLLVYCTAESCTIGSVTIVRSQKTRAKSTGTFTFSLLIQGHYLSPLFLHFFRLSDHYLRPPFSSIYNFLLISIFYCLLCFTLLISISYCYLLFCFLSSFFLLVDKQRSPMYIRTRYFGQGSSA
jgi:hypothetical protein